MHANFTEYDRTPRYVAFDLVLHCVPTSHTMYVTRKLNMRWERSGSVVEFLIRDRVDAGSSLTGVTAL